MSDAHLRAREILPCGFRDHTITWLDVGTRAWPRLLRRINPKTKVGSGLVPPLAVRSSSAPCVLLNEFLCVYCAGSACVMSMNHESPVEQLLVLPGGGLLVSAGKQLHSAFAFLCPVC